MSSGLATVELETGLSETDISSSGVWRGNDDEGRPEAMWIPVQTWLGLEVGVILPVAVPPATAVTDYWFNEERRHVAHTATWVSEGMIGRSISRSEALRISRQIIERAEWERFQLAEWEAERGIQWEEGE